MDLIDKTSKLLAISETEVAILATEIVVATSQATKKDSDSPLVIPAVKKIKVEPVEVTVEVERDEKEARIEESQDVWASFHNTRIQLYAEDKLMIENGQKLSDKHVNFAQAILRVQFPQCEGLQNTLLQNQLKWCATSKIVQIIHVRGDHWVVISNVQLYFALKTFSGYMTLFTMTLIIQQCLS